MIILTPESSSSRHLIQLVTACNRGNYAVKRLQKRILNKYCSIETIPSEKPILTPNCQVDPTQRKNVNDLTFQERKDLNKALGKMKTLSDWRSFEKYQITTENLTCVTMIGGNIL